MATNTPSVTIAQVQTLDKDTNQLQSNIASAFNTYQTGLSSTIQSLQSSISDLQSSNFSSGKILTKQALASGSNNIPHGLGKALTGWVIVRQRASATFYDTQDSNTIPQTTLLLTSSASVTVDIYVF